MMTKHQMIIKFNVAIGRIQAAEPNIQHSRFNQLIRLIEIFGDYLKKNCLDMAEQYLVQIEEF